MGRVTAGHLSPGSGTTDRVTKLAEYASARIPRYWMIDLRQPATLAAHTLVGDRYEIAAKATGKVTLAADRMARKDDPHPLSTVGITLATRNDF